MTGLLKLLALIPVVYLVQQPLVLLPVDEAASRPDFFTFRAGLQRAVARHDAATVIESLCPDIVNSFGGGSGIEEFREMWRPEQPDSALWEKLGTVLALGGAFRAGNFIAPYIFAHWPDDADSFAHVAVVGTNVRIRTAPRSDASVAATVSFSVLRLSEEALQMNWSEKEWTPVELPGKTTGYVATRFVRSPIDYRARFENIRGRWLLCSFVAGD